MTSDQLERVFGRARLKMATGEHVEVHREAAAPGERRRYTKRFLSTGDADFREWTGREWRVLARLIGHGVGCVPDVVQFDGGAGGGMRHVQTYDAGTTVDQWASLLPVRRAGVVAQHVFEDCAHWWSLAMHCLRALDEVHALGLVHLDVKADNICIPHAPASFEPDAQGMRLHVAFNRLALIDFAFSVVTGERLGTALPLGWQKDYDYQSPRLLRALEAGRDGDLAPTEALDWRCDLYSLAAMLRRYLPDDPCARSDGEQAGWTRARYDDARALVYRLRDVHDRERPAWRPHRELIELAAAHLAAPDLVSSLTAGWELADDVDPARGATLATPVTRIAAARATAATAHPSLATGTTLVVAPRTPVRARPTASTPSIQPGIATRASTSPMWTLGPAHALASPLAPPPAVLRRRPELATVAVVPAAIASGRPPHRLRGVAAAVLVSAAVAAAATSIVVDDPARVKQVARDSVERLRALFDRGVAVADSAVASSARDAARSAMPSDAPSPQSAVPAAAPGQEAPQRTTQQPTQQATQQTTQQPGATKADPPASSSNAASPGSTAPHTESANAASSATVANGPAVADAGPLAAPGSRSAPSTAVALRPRPATSVPRNDPTRRSATTANAVKPSRFASTQKSPVAIASARGAGPVAATRVRPTEPPPVVRLASAPVNVAAAMPLRDPEPASDHAVPDASSPGNGVASPPVVAPGAHAAVADERASPRYDAQASLPATAAATPSMPPAAMHAEPSRRPTARSDPWRDRWRDALAALGLRSQRAAPIEDRGAVPPAARSAPPAAALIAPNAAQAMAPTLAVPPGPPIARPAPAEAVGAPERANAPAVAPAPMRIAPPSVATPRTDVAQGPTEAPRVDPPAWRGAEVRPTPTAIESVPRVAELAHADVAQLLWSAAAFNGPIQDQAIVRASTRAWRSEQSYVRVNDAFAGSTLHARARQAFAAGQDRDARDLASRAFAANPRDPDLAGYLAFLELRAGPENAEAARQLALNALAFSGPRRSQRLDDWDTLAVASALTGRHTDAVGAFLVGLAISGSPDRTCRTARHAYVTYGERLRVAVEAVQRKLLAQSGGSAACAPPTLALSRPWP